MKIRKFALLALVSMALSACVAQPALAQLTIIGNPVTPGGVPVQQLPIQIVNPNNGAPCFVGNTGCPTIGGGGGGGSASYTAASSPFTVTAGVNKPAWISTDNSAQGIIPVKPGTTTQIDLSAPGGVIGHDGVNIASSANPLDVQINGTPTFNCGTGCGGGLAQGSITSGQTGSLTMCATTSALPGPYTTATTNPCNTDLSGRMRSLSWGVLKHTNPGTGFATTNLGLFFADDNQSVGVMPAVASYSFSGSTWEPSVACSSIASVNVTAGNTTQIVALSGTTVVRVCSFTLGISANGTFAFTSGTGTNCATPANAMAAIPINTGQLAAQTAPAGGDIYRGSAGGELCISAVTGNVTGFVRYSQY